MELLAHSRLQHISVSAHGSLVEPDTRCGLCGIPVNVSLNNKLSWNEESIFSCCCWCQLSYNRLSFTDLSTSFNAEKFCVNKIKPAHQMMFYLVSVQWKHNVRKPEWKCLRNLRDLFVEMNTVSLFKNNGLKQMSRFWKHGIFCERWIIQHDTSVGQRKLDRNRTHDLPNTWRALYPLSSENSWRARTFNWVHMWQASCTLHARISTVEFIVSTVM